ncbi:Alpha-ketoglutarate-dependent dioxygenase alkB 7, mitochondrial, partial [Balamuthia mandrillaris]
GFEDVVLVDGAEHLIDDPHRCLGSRLRGLRLIPNAITPEEHAALVQELDPLLRAKPYATDHWDDVIADYRETERSLHRFAPANRATLQRLSERWLRFPAAPGEEQPPPLFPHVHVLDLHQRGRMRSHVDSVKFSGGLVAGLSLLSPCVMTLRLEEKEKEREEKEEKGKEEGVEVRMLLPPRSFYVLR